MKRLVAATVTIAAVVLAGAGAWVLTGSLETHPGVAEPIVLGAPVSDGNLLVFVASDQHYFAANRINLTFIGEDTGPAALRDLQDGRIDMAATGEYPVVMKAFEHANISIITSYTRSYNEYLFGRIDRGIRNVSDLNGKTIGIPLGTQPEFFLGRFLELHGMSVKDVHLVNLPPQQAGSAIADGSIDAVVVWEPFASRIQEENPDGLASWQVQSGQALFGVLVCRNDWIQQHPDRVRNVLASLAQAEAYTAVSPAGAQAVLQDHYHYSGDYIARIWPENKYSLTLDQSLVTAMEDESRWMIANNITNATAVPDFRNYIYPDGLEGVKPGSVNIIT